jgi:hypothetical protein
MAILRELLSSSGRFGIISESSTQPEIVYHEA